METLELAAETRRFRFSYSFTQTQEIYLFFRVRFCLVAFVVKALRDLEPRGAPQLPVLERHFTTRCFVFPGLIWFLYLHLMMRLHLVATWPRFFRPRISCPGRLWGGSCRRLRLWSHHRNGHILWQGTRFSAAVTAANRIKRLQQMFALSFALRSDEWIFKFLCT